MTIIVDVKNELLDRIEAAEKERDALRAAVRHEADCVEACKSEIEALRAKIARMEQQEPVFWWRPCSDGAYEGPLHNNSIERVRKQSGAWSPLYALPGAQPAPSVPTDVITDYLVSISAHLAHQDDRKAQAEIGELLKMLAAAPEAKP